MEQAYKWTATSNPPELADGQELADIAGKWGTGIDVQVTKPFQHITGPIKTITTPEGLPNSLPITIQH